MEEKLLRFLIRTSRLLAILIAIVTLIYIIGDLAHIIVPFVVVIGLSIYIIYDINRKKTRMKKVPDWDDFVEKHRVKGIQKAYHKENRDRHSGAGRRKHMEARIRGKR